MVASKADTTVINTVLFHNFTRRAEIIISHDVLWHPSYNQQIDTGVEKL